MRTRIAVSVAGSLAAIIGFGGCSGDHCEIPAEVQTGGVLIRIAWPVRANDVGARLIPVASNSIKAELLSAGEVSASHTVTVDRPQTQARISEVRVGSYVVRARAYPQPEAQGVAQAAAQTTVTVVAGQDCDCPLTLQSTIHHIDVSPSAGTVQVGDSLALSATAKDVAGQTVLVPTTNAFVWHVGSGSACADVDPATGVVTGKTSGNATVTATEQESGKSGSASVEVLGLSTIHVRIE